MIEQVTKLHSSFVPWSLKTMYHILCQLSKLSDELQIYIIYVDFSGVLYYS